MPHSVPRVPSRHSSFRLLFKSQWYLARLLKRKIVCPTRPRKCKRGTIWQIKKTKHSFGLMFWDRKKIQWMLLGHGFIKHHHPNVVASTRHDEYDRLNNGNIWRVRKSHVTVNPPSKIRA